MTNLIPKEVEIYLSGEKKTLIKITPSTEDYSLLLKYNDGATRKYDMSDKMYGVFEILKNKNKFLEVFIDENGNIAWDIENSVSSFNEWNNRIDICADSAYIYGSEI